MPSITIYCPNEECELELNVGYEPPDYNYGADADGNRGMYVAGYAYLEYEVPAVCPTCKHEFDPEELKALEDAAEKAIKDAGKDDVEPDYDDYYDDEPRY